MFHKISAAPSLTKESGDAAHHVGNISDSTDEVTVGHRILREWFDKTVFRAYLRTTMCD